MKYKDKSSSYCNNCHRQSNKHFCNFYKCLGHNIETCYHHNKLVVCISAATVANTESIQPMAPILAKFTSSGSVITISIVDLQNIIANTICMVGNASYSFYLLVFLVYLLPLSLWILVVAITWNLTHPYFLNLNLHHTLLIFAQQMVPQCLVII